MFKSVICALHKFAICNDAASSELAANLTAVSTPPVIVSPPIQKVTNFPNFPFNEDKRLTHNLLVYQDTPACATLAQDLANHDSYKRVTAPVSAEFHHAFFDKEPVEGKCEVACLDLGSPEHLVTRVFPERIHNLEPVESSHVSWYQKQCQAKELGIVNTGYETVNIFWVNQDSQRVKVGSISNGEKHTFWTGTYLGHVFEVTDASNDQLLESVTIQCDTFIPVGGLLNGVDPNFVPAGYPDLNTAVRNTLDIEWGRHNAVTRHFTDVGFAKGRLPTDLFCSMTTYYYNNRNNRMREEWKSKGLFVNWWVVDAHFIPMPHTLKRYWQRRLKDLVEAWSNTKLELTDIYGMRQYNEGASLLTHVDRTPTHAASLIINVAQGNIAEPWKVEIYDHANRLHQVEMEEGDIVYYESAKCLHGRMATLKGPGAYYVNLFAHYRPDGDPEWSTKPVPEGQPEPIINLEGIDIARALPHIAPTGETLHSGADLFNFWQKVVPQATRVPAMDEL